MKTLVHVVPGDRIELGGEIIIVDEFPAGWPRDWRHGVLSSPDKACEPAGERCGPHRASWPIGPRCVIGALWDAEQAP